MEKRLLDYLTEEKEMKLKGGLYHHSQIEFAYNTNHIEGSRLTEDQTRYIYETNSINSGEKEAVNIDDIIETKNHFRCFDYMLDTADKKLTSGIIKEYHKILKQGTSDSEKEWFKVGEYKSRPNFVGGIETTEPENVNREIEKLLQSYLGKEKADVFDIIDFHYNFEKIHPFQDGNGRVGRLIMFKECLKNDIVPFIIKDKNKQFYYRGLKEYNKIDGYLKDTCLHEQDEYKKLLEYFKIKS
jgi:Fic family protein